MRFQSIDIAAEKQSCSDSQGQLSLHLQ